MTGARLRLESFDTVLAPARRESPAGAAAAEALEDVRLAAYETGYAAGWEDAMRAQADARAQLGEELARNLRDLSFTYQEARAHVLAGLEPLLLALSDRVLPLLARGTLGLAVAAEVSAEAARLAGAPVELSVAPDDLEAVAAVLCDDPALPVRLAADAALAAGQVRFRFGAEERLLDLEAVLARIGTLMRDFLATALPDERPRAHG